MYPLSKENHFKEAQWKTLSRRGVKSVSDLLYYLPRRYIDRSQPLEIRTTKVGDIVTFLGKVSDSKVSYGRRKRLNVTVSYQGVNIEIVFFQGIPFYSRMLTSGVEAAFSGTLDSFRGRLTMSHPEIEILSGDEFIHTGKIIPLYKITDAMRKNYLTSRSLRQAIHHFLKKYSPSIQDHLNAEDTKTLKLIALSEALQKIHFPETMGDTKEARKRLAFDELLFFSIIMKHQKELRKKIKRKNNIHPPEDSKWITDLKKSLPFELTNDQKKAIENLHNLSTSPNPFAALLQGDVGSGKTLVALFAAIPYIEAGHQVVLMAPTEILARQHFANFINYISVLPMVQIDLLLGAEKASDKRAKLDRLQRGDTRLIIGTHSLLQKGVVFSSLALTIIDEQHRFGVEQRKVLFEKGDKPDLLAMTATPIPRSLTLTLYGDFETIFLKEKPPGRKAIDTRLFPESELRKLYLGVKKYVNQGRQAFIVYPVIDDKETNSWASIEADYRMLEDDIFKDYRLGLLHGRLSGEEKDRAMQKFKDGEIQIIVATTVVEVGIDIPNANVMLIRNAEKFGLSQLHQLRGRVGRGSHQSFCILVQSERCTPEGRERLKAMIDSEDGFYLAQKDLEIRGPGEILGLKQAGLSEFKIADIRYDGDLIEAASNYLNNNEALYHRIIAQKGKAKKSQGNMMEIHF